jgi:predicted Zn-dependent peptidase
MISILLAAALIPQAPLATRTVRPEAGPEVRVHRQASPLVAIRVSAAVPVDLPEGAVELLQELARPAAEAQAQRFGARLTFRHEDGRAVVAVTGPVSAFDAMVAIVRQATGPPDLAVASLRRARPRSEDRVLARLEQPGPRIRRFLRYELYGGPEPRGAPATRLEPEAVRRLQARLYRPDRLGVVLVGAVPDVVIRSAFARWPGGRDPASDAPIPVDSTGPAAQPQTHREWGGIAFPAEGGATLAVAAELVEERVAQSALRYGAAEAWYEPAPALAVIGAATPGDSVVSASAGISDLAARDSAAVAPTDMRRYLRRLIAEAAALAGPDMVAAARATVRRRLLLEARTATGKAEVIGQTMDRFGSETDVEDYLQRLDAVTAQDVQALLTGVLETPASLGEG